jgi:hypothetical protein
MKQPQPKPRGMTAMGQNRALDNQAKTLGELTVLCSQTAIRVLELTELATALAARVGELEARA